MTTGKKLILEQKITEFFESDEMQNNPEGYVHEKIISQMADASEAVFDSVMEYQKWAIKEKVHD